MGMIPGLPVASSCGYISTVSAYRFITPWEDASLGPEGW